MNETIGDLLLSILSHKPGSRITYDLADDALLIRYTAGAVQRGRYISVQAIKSVNIDIVKYELRQLNRILEEEYENESIEQPDT